MKIQLWNSSMCHKRVCNCMNSSTNQRCDNKIREDNHVIQTCGSYRTLCITYMRVIFPCVVRQATAHGHKKVLNMCHQSKKGFHYIFVVIPQHQKGYLVYVPSTRKIISSYDVVFYECFSSALAYTPQSYAGLMAILPAV